MNRDRVLVVGATGILGGGLMQHLSRQHDLAVVGVSRSGGVAASGDRTLAVDLLDPADCAAKLGAMSDVTHIFYAAYQWQPNRADEVAPNVAMLANVVNAVADASPALRSVVLITGAKMYGMQWGPSRTPMRESDRRHLPPNFYYDQEDFLRARQAGQKWTWTNLIPPFITGFALGNAMNLVMAIAVFATISKELGVPLRFPGSEGAHRALQHFADADQVAAAAHWAARAPEAANRAFNVANGDLSRWRHLWPSFARFFRMELEDPKEIPLATIMADKGPVWAGIIEKYGLVETHFDKLVNWSWADYLFRMEYDTVLELGQIRRAGFHAYPDVEGSFLRRFSELQERRIIPSWS
jgi:nucleoside-diphosphate-sugar epimerase